MITILDGRFNIFEGSSVCIVELRWPGRDINMITANRKNFGFLLILLFSIVFHFITEYVNISMCYAKAVYIM